MLECNRKYLLKTFPNLYINKDEPADRYNIPFWFECGDGWFDLIRRTSVELELLILDFIKTNPHVPETKRPCAKEIKEYRGKLKIVMRFATPAMKEVVEKAQEESTHICEFCGDKGELQQIGWLITICENCAEARGYINKEIVFEDKRTKEHRKRDK